MAFLEYLQSQNPQSAMAGSMAGPAGGSYGQMAMQTLQNSQRAAQAAQAPAPQVPGGPSHPDPGPGAAAQPPMGGGYAGPSSPMMQQGLPPQYQGAGQNNPMFQMNPNGPFSQPPQMDPAMQDPEYQQGYQIGMMLLQAMQQGR